MPTYEYECNKCGHKFEVFHSITAEPLKKCPKCKGKIRRLIGTGSGIIFKGAGFYATDYRKKEKKTESSKGSSCSTCTPKGCPTCKK
jgi:putative FmdB family regulatory protein